MPTGIPEAVKSQVIQRWIMGDRRDTIAVNSGLSSGAVTNIVEQWKANLGFAKAEEIRELGIALRMVGITPAQCALGFRVGTTMMKLGVKDDDFESFILDVYNRCKDLALSPANVTSHLKELFEFSETNTLPLSQIPGYLVQKEDERKKLQLQIQLLDSEITTLQEEKLASEKRLEAALDNENKTASGIRWYMDLKEELGRYGIPVDHLSKVARLFHGIKQEGYDVGTVLKDFSDLDSMRKDFAFYRTENANLKKEYDGLKDRCYSLEQTIQSHNQTISKYNELSAIGFGLKELKQLWHTITEVATANGIKHDLALHKFLKDIEEDYDNKVGFELKLNQLRSEIIRVTNNINISRATWQLQPLTGPSLERLFAKGILEQDIVEIADLFERSSDQSTGGDNIIDRQTLMSDIRKYRSLKLAVQELSQDMERLEDEKFGLQLQDQSLDEAKRNMGHMLAYSRQIIPFLLKPNSAANSYENEEKILTMLAHILQNLYVGQRGAQKLVDGNLDGFLPVVEISATQDLAALRTAVANGLDVMTRKLVAKAKGAT